MLTFDGCVLMRAARASEGLGVPLPPQENVSEGKSGCFFYRVAGGAGASESRFIVKQISRCEKRQLMALLPAYEGHVAQRNGSSLVRYLGCHSMTLRWRFSGKVRHIAAPRPLPAFSSRRPCGFERPRAALSR